MRKPRKTAVVAALLATVGFLGTGTAYAHGQGHGHGHKNGHSHAKGHQGRESETVLISQSTSCTVAEENVDVQGESGFENGREGNQPNGKGSPGQQTTNVGSRLGCDNTLVLGK
ncbi:hypothetical protein GCM10010260_45870 [Streptomyces filipinensis]|uniref:Secreted protein n=1 Tax=Streptomyces filipinensis TaxID=66887 RepID=A0A918IDQ6_9ACTN|nr:hypothetical protein [Streptomyces filipinensis]GGV03785.1 hypothetical protein GCM10010260_45870 [Streptomyces filipinensis]